MAADKKKKKSNRWQILLIMSALISLLLNVFYNIPEPLDFLKIKKILRSIENSSRNMRFVIRENLVHPRQGRREQREPGSERKMKKDGIYNRIVIAAVDDKTIQAQGGSYPFDRKYWADFINRLNTFPPEKRPELVFFDIVFAGQSQRPASDAALVAAFSNYRGAIGEDIMLENPSQNYDIQNSDPEAKKRLEDSIYFKYTLSRDSREALSIDRFRLHGLKPHGLTFFWPVVSSMMPPIADSLSFVGSANIDNMDTDYFELGKKPMIVRTRLHSGSETNVIFENAYYPSIVLAMACKLYDVPLSNISTSGLNLVLKNALIDGKRQDLTIPLEKKYRLPVNFRSRPFSGFINVRSVEGLDPSSLPDHPILFVGMYSQKGAHDIWPSPMGSMFGIEQIAYALGTIMNRDFLLRLPDSLTYISVFVLSLVIGAFVLGGIGWTVLAGLLSILVPFLIGTLLFIFNIQIVVMIPLMAAILTVISMQLYILLTEQKEKQFIKSTFSKYVNPALVDILIQNPDLMKLGGQNAELTVFFSDIKGFAGMVGEKSPAEIVRFLNEFFTEMTDIVMKYNGTIDKYIGDILMAFWGAPIADPKNALFACETAIRMNEALEKFNSSRALTGEKPIRLDFGINTGNMIVGNVGSEKIKNYTVIGDAVNLASRLKGLNKFYHTSIVISEFTYQKVKDHVIVRELDLTRVKGKALPVRIYELIDMKN